MTVHIRRANDRGHADHGWLNTHHTFSFADYWDPEQTGFRALRVLNDDRVSAGRGFGAHGHRDMEIVSYVVHGALEHKDSLGNGSVVRAGELQRMTAGTGIRHSEFNPSPTDELRFLQIWITPNQTGLKPGYEQRAFPLAERKNALRLLVSPTGQDGSLTIHQDAWIYGAHLTGASPVVHSLAQGRHAWIQLITGAARVGEHILSAGDGASISNWSTIQITGKANAELLLLDLA